MRMSRLLVRTLREAPADAEVTATSRARNA